MDALSGKMELREFLFLDTNVGIFEFLRESDQWWIRLKCVCAPFARDADALLEDYMIKAGCYDFMDEDTSGSESGEINL